MAESVNNNTGFKWFRSPEEITISISNDKVIESWHAIVEGGGGRDMWFLNMTETYITESNMPDVTCRRTQVNTGFFGPERTFLRVWHKRLREYAMYIGARDYGQNLDIGWYLTLTPGFLKRQFSKFAMGSPQAMSMMVDLFSQQDLRAYVTVSHHCVNRTVKMLMEELEQDYSIVDRKSKGFLSVW